MNQPTADNQQQPVVVWIERGIFACLVLIALFAPNSIAVTQTAWLLGMTLWLVRLVIRPRQQLFRTPLDYAVLAFFILSGISGIFSYSPVISIGKMRAASLFTIVYLVAQNVTSFRVVQVLSRIMIFACLVNVLISGGAFVVGRGVKVEGVKAESPLAKALFRTRTVQQPTPIIDGDTVWEVDGKKVDDPQQLAALLAAGPDPALVRIYRLEWMPTLEVPRGKLLPGTTALEQLGIGSWSRGRDWRATGLFSHWVTYAEVLQLIASLTLGLFLALPRKNSVTGRLLLFSVIGLAFALGLTVTRASWVGFAVSVATMLALTVSRRALLIAGACAIPLVLAGVFVLQQKRNIGFIDSKDQSTSWRQTVWREGFELLVSKPRHLLVGVGIDSIKGHWREWGLFDHGRLPIGHMHSNLLQIALERGVPALIAWLGFLGLYARMLLKIVLSRPGTSDKIDDQQLANGNFPTGLALGALGGLVGFFTSGLVHYNWGDSEVVTVLYFIMGLSLFVERMNRAVGQVAGAGGRSRNE